MKWSNSFTDIWSIYDIFGWTMGIMILLICNIKLLAGAMPTYFHLDNQKKIMILISIFKSWKKCIETYNKIFP